MRKYLIFAALFAASCNNEVTTIPAPPASTPKAAHKASEKIDPVCEMPYDTAWTNKTVYQGDTINFCSDNCEKAFKLKPTKYIQGS